MLGQRIYHPVTLLRHQDLVQKRRTCPLSSWSSVESSPNLRWASSFQKCSDKVMRSIRCMATLSSDRCLTGMAGSGKTTLMQRMAAHLHASGQPAYILNLDPAVTNVPYAANIDIRYTVSDSRGMPHEDSPSHA